MGLLVEDFRLKALGRQRESTRLAMKNLCLMEQGLGFRV